MLAKLARCATDKAHRYHSIRWLKLAWFLRSLRQWLRGGDWHSPSVAVDREKRKRQPRQPLPRVEWEVQ